MEIWIDMVHISNNTFMASARTRNILVRSGTEQLVVLENLLPDDFLKYFLCSTPLNPRS